MGTEELHVAQAEDWQRVDERLGGVEDSIVRRFSIEGSDEVLPDKRLAYGGDGAACKVEIQTQFDDFAVATLRFERVHEIRYDPSLDITPMRWSADSTGWQVEFLSLVVRAETCTVTVES